MAEEAKKPAAKKPTQTATTGGAGAQPPDTIASYAGASTTGTPQDLESGPYQVVPWSGPDVPIPGSTIPGQPGTNPAMAKGASASEIRQAAIEGLAKYFHITTSPPGTTLEEQVTDALAQKYHTAGTTTAAEKGQAGVPDTRTPAEKKDEPDTSNPFPQSQDPFFAPTKAKQKADTKTAVQAAVPGGGFGHPGAASGLNSAALSQIAKQLNLPDNEDPLVAIAGKLGIHNPKNGASFDTSAATQAHADTTAQQYAGFVSVAFDKKGNLTKQGTAIEKNLVQAGFLDETTSGGTPTANDVQKAYQSYLGAAVNGINSGDPSTSLPPGQGLQAAITYGEKQAKTTQDTATSSESYSYTQGIAAEFGVYLTPNQINSIISDPKIASEITSTGSPDNVADQIKTMVIALYDPTNPNDPAGVANSMFTQIQQAALSYQLPITAANISQMVKNGLQTASVAYPASAVTDVVSKATQAFQQQAAGLYPTVAPQIEAGMSLGGSGGLFTPYFNVAEQYTGVPAASMMADQSSGGISKWGAFAQGGQDPKTGAPTLQTLDQWKKTLMTDPQYGFQNTQGAKNMASQFTSAILNEFGKVNTQGNSSGSAFNSYNPSSALQANTS